MLTQLKSVLVFLWIALIPIQDSLLQATQLRFAGASLSVLPLAALAIIFLIEELSRFQISRKATGTVFLCAGYVALTTGIDLVVYQGEYQPSFLTSKAVKSGLLIALFLLPISLTANSRPKVVRWATYTAFWLATTGVLLGDVVRWSAIQVYFHFTPNMNLRPRGLAVESTVLGVQIATLGLLSAYFARSSAIRCVFIAVTLTVIIYSGSKGAGAVVILALSTVALLANEGKKAALPWRRLVRLALPALLILGAGGTLAANFSRSTQEYSSVTTRVTTVVAASEACLRNPLGMGLAGLLPAMNTYLPRAMALVQRLHLLVNFSEVAAYVNNRNGLDVDTKSFLFDQLIIFGVPFLWIFWRFHRRLLTALLSAKEHYWLVVTVVFCLIALVTYYPALGYYNVPLVYGVALAASRWAEDSRSCA